MGVASALASASAFLYFQVTLRQAQDDNQPKQKYVYTAKISVPTPIACMRIFMYLHIWIDNVNKHCYYHQFNFVILLFMRQILNFFYTYSLILLNLHPMQKLKIRWLDNHFLWFSYKPS